MADQQVTEVYREFRCECAECVRSIWQRRCRIRYVHVTTDANEVFGIEHYPLHRFFCHTDGCEQYADECRQLRKTAD